LSSSVLPRFPVMALCRSDAERRDTTDRPSWSARSVHVADWPAENANESWMPARLLGRAGTTLSRHGFHRSIRLANWSFDQRAWSRLQRGLDLLCTGHAIATDRLHAYILASKLGKHYFVADNSYGKLSSVYSTWLEGTGLGTWSSNLNHAIESALKFGQSQSSDV
jgi:exopolysaccharide biosynthesis predicted pyruvyltransferase EpsI